MAKLNETIVLNYFLNEMENNNISFLKNKKECTKKIKNKIIELRDEKSMNKKIIFAKELWKQLFESSMSYIDPDKRGYDRLFAYFDEYVNFEELIFASDSFYRDHTLHSLWVYFLGEYIIRQEEFKRIKNIMGDEKNRTEHNKKILESLDMNETFGNIIDVYDKVLEMFTYDESVRCVSALTHDLGYPLKKIEKINKSIKDVLPYFSLNNYDEFNFNYSEIQQNYISEFIEFLSDHINVSSNDKLNETILDDATSLKILKLDEINGTLTGFNKDEILKLTKDQLHELNRVFQLSPRIFKNVSKHWAYSRDFEEYKHGIMSAFLLQRNVKAFSNIKFIYCESMDNNFYNINWSDIMAKQNILVAISDHTSDGYQITDISTKSAFLTFIDELEEFSRISRANQNREYVEEFCNTDICMNEDYFQVDFTFYNEKIDNLDPERTFKSRCQRFLELFDIKNLNKDLKIRLRCIGQLPNNKNIYTLELGRKYVKIMINDEEKSIPEYLKSKQLYTREEYAEF